MSQEKNYYKILRILPTATLEQIKAAFRIRSKETHPDTRDRSDFHAVKEAYEVLSDLRQREQYDQLLKLEAEKNAAKQEVDAELHAQEEVHQLKKRDAAYKKIESMSEGESERGPSRK